MTEKNCLGNCQNFGRCKIIEREITEFNMVKTEREKTYARLALTCEDYRWI